jgi:SnoaL-like domain
MTLDELLAREAIRDLVTRYNSNGDTGRFEHLWELFVDDAVMEVGPSRGERTVYRGLEEVKKVFTRAQDRVQDQGPSKPNTYIRHFTATHQIDLLDADHASGRCYFAVIIGNDEGGGLDHWGRYVDDYVRADDRWRFQRRRVYVDGATEASWFSPRDV